MQYIRMEQWSVLWYNANGFSKRCKLDLLDILTIDKDLSGGGRVESVKQAKDSGFTTTRRSNDGYLLAGRDRKSEILEDESVGMISKRDVIELDGPSFKS
jgi:hypothetical protein